jgi:hypothetical protein
MGMHSKNVLTILILFFRPEPLQGSIWSTGHSTDPCIPCTFKHACALFKQQKNDEWLFNHGGSCCTRRGWHSFFLHPDTKLKRLGYFANFIVVIVSQVLVLQYVLFSRLIRHGSGIDARHRQMSIRKQHGI